MSQRKPFKILLVEDDPYYAEVMQTVLGAHVAVQKVASLAEAIIKANGQDAVFLDLTLPDSDGLETFHRVREKFPSKPVVIVTGNSDKALAMRALQAGARDYIVKAEGNIEQIENTLTEIIEELERGEKFDEAMKYFQSSITRLSA